MIAILYCRRLPVEQMADRDRERLLHHVNLALSGLTDEERRDWTLVLVQNGRKPKRLWGPGI